MMQLDDQQASLLNLPLDVVNEIIYYLSEGWINLNQKRWYHTNFYIDNITPNYGSLLSLSSTCRFFRKHLGTSLFHQISLIRRNQTDCILSIPKDFEMFSTRDHYYRELIREILFMGFNECSRADLARIGFRMEDEGYKCGYHDISVNNYVEYLECGKELITSGNVKLFPNIKVLKLLDGKFEYNSIEHNLIMTNLEFLSLNIVNISLMQSVIPQIKRLDLFIDFNEINEEPLNLLIEILSQKCNLTQCNLFLSDFSTIGYTLLLLVIKGICYQNVDKLSLRLVRRSSQSLQYQPWDITTMSGDFLIDCLKTCNNLKWFTLDAHLLNYLNFTEDESTQSSIPHQVTLIIVEPSLILPYLTPDFKIKLLLLIKTIGMTNLSLMYGDPRQQSDLSALRLIVDFLVYLNEHDIMVNHLAIEQCWSTAEETILRDVIRDNIFSYKQHPNPFDKFKLKTFSPWYALVVNSPKFRKPTFASIIYNETIQFSYTKAPPKDNPSRAFWNVESSLMELEQYTRSQRKVSSIWDT